MTRKRSTSPDSGRGRKTSRDTPRGPRAKKHLGQHFLANRAVQERIIAAGELTADDVALEIGPGTGAITRHLVEQARKVYAVETDPRMCELLRLDLPTANLTVIEADFLTFDLASVPDITKIYGNLPYYISSPILEKLILEPSSANDVVLTVQWEFGERLAATPGGKDYGSLSCFVQYRYDVRVLFRIPPSAFRPAPKVSSCCVRLRRRPPEVTADDEGRLFRIIQTAFTRRRKTILNALGGTAARAELERKLTEAGIDPAARPETIHLGQYTRLANLF